MRKKRLCGFLALSLLCSTVLHEPAGRISTKSGTAVVMLYSKHGAIFAAESRVTLAGKSSTGYRDDACKVRAIKNKFIFVAAGVIGFEPKPGETGHGWSGYDEPGKSPIKFRTAPSRIL